LNIATAVAHNPMVYQQIGPYSPLVAEAQIYDPNDFYTHEKHSSLMAKVYAVVSSQLFTTFLVVLPMYTHKKYVNAHALHKVQTFCAK
jgi:hypothetical protein